ncbi:MAG: CDGSH iron-sulfur domain-containing protein [Planctomycetota bacterium]
MTDSRPQPPGHVSDGPFVDRCPPGKHAWCRCAKSGRYPLCDGTHRGSDVQPLKVVFEEARTVSWCGCGRTGDAPFCDGSHGR